MSTAALFLFFWAALPPPAGSPPAGPPPATATPSSAAPLPASSPNGPPPAAATPPSATPPPATAAPAAVPAPPPVTPAAPLSTSPAPLATTTPLAAPAKASGPTLELPPEADRPLDAAPEQVPDPDHPPSLDLGAGRRIPIGAYGETHLVFQGDDTKLTLRRIVLFFGHRFNDWASVYSELEVENISDFEIEQSYLELRPFRRFPIGFRAGLVLMPIGIINVFHEPPTFNGVDRPTVDQLIIPSTWRELGAGFFGRIVDGLHFQLYLVDGPNGAKFTPGAAIGPGLNRGFTVNTENIAVVGRLDYTGVLGLDIGASAYYATANDRASLLNDAAVTLLEADARFERAGFKLRAEYARVFIKGAATITELLRRTDPGKAALGSAAQGFYAEGSYNVLRLMQQRSQALYPFVRYEYVDTRAALPDVPNPLFTPASQYVTAGLTYLPIPQIAFKFDYRRRVAGDDLQAPDRYSLGFGFMY